MLLPILKIFPNQFDGYGRKGIKAQFLTSSIKFLMTVKTETAIMARSRTFICFKISGGSESPLPLRYPVDDTNLDAVAIIVPVKGAGEARRGLGPIVLAEAEADSFDFALLATER
jgi:hypothetical protein